MATKARHSLPDGYGDKLSRHAETLASIAREGDLYEDDFHEVLEIAASLKNMSRWGERNADRV